MRRVITLVLLGLFVACGGGGGGGSDDDDRGTAPVVEEAVLYRMVQGVMMETLAFDVGDFANLDVVASDPDLDMRVMYMTEYLAPEMVVSYGPVVESVLPSQVAFRMRYFLLEDVEVTGPVGDWRICFYVVDGRGNESNDFCLNYLIM